MEKTPGDIFLEDLESTHDASGLHVSDIISQAGQLITVSGLAFGFLLSISVSQKFETTIGEVLCTIALMCTASAIFVLLLPQIYIHRRFPIDKKQILHFYVWSHRFILTGIVLLVVGIYFAVFFALIRLIDWFAPLVAAIIFVLPLIVYRLRRTGLSVELT